MNRPRVSILMAVRDEALHLPAALASLRRQSLKDWELVAVDDGSVDATPSLLADAAGRDPRIRLFRCPPRGLVAALNHGLENCRASLVARMDGDDISHPRRLELQADYLETHPEVGLVASAVRHFPRSRIRNGMRAYEAWQNRLRTHEAICRDLFVESPFAHPSVMYRRETVLGLGGYRDCGWAEDYDLWLQMAARGVRFAKLPERLLFWRDRPERLTRIAPHCSAEAFRACKAHHLRHDFLRGIKEVTLWGAGMEGKAWRKTLGQIPIRVARWVEIDPRKIGQRIHGAPVISPEELRSGAGKVLITIGAKGARAQVRDFAAEAGLVEGRDYLCVT